MLFSITNNDYEGKDIYEGKDSDDQGSGKGGEVSLLLGLLLTILYMIMFIIRTQMYD